MTIVLLTDHLVRPQPLLQVEYDSTPAAEGSYDASVKVTTASADIVVNFVWLQKIGELEGGLSSSQGAGRGGRRGGEEREPVSFLATSRENAALL